MTSSPATASRQNPPSFSRAFWRFWAGHTLALFGDVLFSAGMMWFVYRTTGSALATSGVALMETGARVLGSLLAGPLADRRVRSRWMAQIHGFKMALVLAVALALARGGLTPWLVYAVAFALNLFNAFYEPVYGALVPDLVATAVLTRANAFVQVSRTLAYGVSWGLSGLSLEALGPMPVAWANVLVFGLAMTLFLSLPRGSPVLGSRKGTSLTPAVFWRDVREGLALYRQKKVLQGLLVVSFPGWLTVGLWGPLLLVYLNRVLGVGPAGWGWNQAVFFLSGLVGSVLAASVLGVLSWPEGRWVAGVAWFHGMLTLAFALAPSYWWALVTVALAGITDPFLQAARMALLQHAVSERLRGRVLAVWQALMYLTLIGSYTALGLLGEAVPLRGLYASSGVFVMGTVLIAALGFGLARVRVQGERT